MEFACECGVTIKVYTPTGETPHLIEEVIKMDHLEKGHEEVEAWQATKIREIDRRAQRRGKQQRAS